MIRKKNRAVKSALLGLLFCFMLSPVVKAQQVEDFYIPFPESSALTFFQEIATNGLAQAPLITRTDIVVREVDTVIIFDPAADGYESEYLVGPFLATTEFWGDGDCSNGFKPTIATCNTGADDTLNVGEVLVFDNTQVSGSDYFRANKIINLTRSLWPTGTGTFLAGAFELFPSSQWGTSYVVPVGEDTPGSGAMFEQVAVTIMAENDNTTVEFDSNGPSVAGGVITTVLNRGESVEYGLGAGVNGQALAINEGATITASEPVQANVLTGDPGSTYEARFYTLFPDSLLSNSYYEAVGTTNAADQAAVFLYNPTNAQITVEYFDNLNPTAAPTSVNIAANSSAKVIMPAATANGLTGVRFTSTGGEVFSAYTIVDDNGQIKDWGHVTTPLRLMGDTVRVGFAPGNDPDSANTLNASPIWLIADVPGQGVTQDIQICVDGQGNGGPSTDLATGREYDYVVTVQPLDSSRLYNSGPDTGVVRTDSEDQTGMLAFACNTANDPAIANPADVVIAAAWGQDPQYTASGDSGFDVGTTIRTGSNNRLFIGDTIFEDLDADGIQDIGEVGIANVDVTISTTNPLIDVDPDVIGIQNTKTIQTDADGLYLFTGLTSGEDYTITVTPSIGGLAQVSDPDGILDNQTTLNLTSSTLTQDFGYQVTPLGIDKSSSAAGAPVQPGDTITYTIVVANSGFAPETNIVLNDVLPAGVTYVANSAMKTYPTGGGTTTGSFTSSNLAGPTSFDAAGITVNSDTTGSVPAGATLDTFSFTTDGNSIDFLSDLAVVATLPSGATAFTLPGGTFGGGAPGAWTNIGAGPSAFSGTAEGIYSFAWTDSFDIAAAPENTISNLVFTIGYTATTPRVNVTDAANAPANMVTAADNITLLPGEIMTVVFDVVVDDPFAFAITELTNSAQATSDQTPDPIEDTVVDEIVDGLISGRVWLDEDLDGILDIEEAGLTNIEVFLCNNPPVTSGTLCTAVNSIASTLTDQNGNYSFDGLKGGDYVISANESTLPAGLTDTAGQFGLDSRDVTLPIGGEVTDEDFGYIPTLGTGAIGDRVWADADGDGVQDPGEAGIEGVTLELRDGSCTPSVNCPTTTTNSNGDYLFTNVPFDEYVVAVLPGSELSGFTPTVGPQSVGGLISPPVTLSPQLTAVTDLDFGFDNNNLNTISDTVWFDEDGDGVQDPNEPGIPGITVDIVNASGDVVGTAITDENGVVVFSGLPDGTYNLRVTDNKDDLDGLDGTTSEGVAKLSDPVAVSGGTTLPLDTSFGYNNPGLIAGTVYSDPDSPTDTNNNQDPGEAGIAGTTVELFLDGLLVATTTTDAVGDYAFDGLVPGDYTVIVTPASASQTEDPDGPTDRNDSTVITLGAGESSVENDFGYFDVPDLFDISGVVFLDTDKDGVEEKPEDTGIESITLALIDTTTGEILSTTTTADGTTDANGDGNIDADDLGYYEFTGVPAGDYQVAVTDENGQLAGYDITSGLDALPVTLVNADVSDVDFGYIKEEATGSIEGELFIDEDSDGVAGDDEFNLSNVTVYLCLAEDAPCTSANAIQTTTTDANGDYSFTGLPPGTYEVGPESTDPDIPSDIDLTVDPAPVALSEGENVTDVDVGYEPAPGTGVLSGVVWVDANNNGVLEPGEAPIPGVDISVFKADEFTPFTSAVSGSDGSWIITGIPAADIEDDLFVTYDQGDIPTNLDVDQPSNLPTGDDRYTNINLLSDDDNAIGNLDFGFPPETSTDLGLISGTIYTDDNAPTPSNDYEPAIDGELEGVTINLIDCGNDGCGNANDQVISTVSTDANGFYEFAGLPDGTYDLQITDLGNELQDLNPNAETAPNPAAGLVISGGNDFTNQDAGYIQDQRLGSIGSLFWLDSGVAGVPGSAGDGIYQDGERGIAGVTIQCWLDADTSETPNSPPADDGTPAGVVTGAPQPGIDNLIRTVTTDDNGEYYCTSLPSGQYIVVVADAGGFNEAADGTNITGDIADNNAKPWRYALTTNSPNLTADFGVTGSNQISGTVFVEDPTLVEPDGNTTIDAGELDGVAGGNPDSTNTPSIDAPAGVPVVLFVEQNGTFVEVASTVTDADGNYVFDNLPDGNYIVEVQPQGSVIDGFGQTGDPDLAAVAANDEELVCDSDTAGFCDDSTGTPIVLNGSDASDINFGYQENFVTTPVTVTYFSASSVSGGVEFTWETANEVGHLGYQIYARADDDWVLLNDDLILSDGGAMMEVRTHSYTATGSSATEATWFALVDVATNEELMLHGPYRLGETHGQPVVQVEAFDWSGIQLRSPSNAEVSESVNARLQQLLEADERAARSANPTN